MPQKGRLPADEKVRIVEAYISGQTSAYFIQTQYGIGWTTLRDWIRLYKSRGVEGLAPTGSKRKYTVETKSLAVAEYLTGQSSQDTICLKYNMTVSREVRKKDS